ncbi:hypothetical protein GCM10023350_40030 [Nocardioides endophyticus]|uniref:Alanine and proline-rich secreted protein Apa n=1 Tax=Nocardioides endophyticus TaxID=1353775 RepID=A0ABP8ZA60_9ACTN
MTDHDPTQLSAALRERVRDEDPDLDQLIQVSTRTGVRLRRRRTLGISLAGAAAGVAVIGIVGASLGDSGGTPGSEPGFATQPTAAASPSAPPVTADGLVLAPMKSSPPASMDVLAPTSGLHPQKLPVRVAPSLKGWEIGTAADDKFPALKDRYFVSVNVRPMSEYASWSGSDPDRPASQVVHVGDNYFVTVHAPPGSGVPQGDIDELVAALRYKPIWRR